MDGKKAITLIELQNFSRSINYMVMIFGIYYYINLYLIDLCKMNNDVSKISDTLMTFTLMVKVKHSHMKLYFNFL